MDVWADRQLDTMENCNGTEISPGTAEGYWIEDKPARTYLVKENCSGVSNDQGVWAHTVIKLTTKMLQHYCVFFPLWCIKSSFDFVLPPTQPSYYYALGRDCSTFSRKLKVEDCPHFVKTYSSSEISLGKSLGDVHVEHMLKNEWACLQTGYK